MNTRKNFYKNHESRKFSFKKGHFVLLMCIGLIAIVAFTMINIQFASAETPGKMLNKTPEYPIMPGNYTEIQYCSECHLSDPEIWISVTEYSNTTGDITYYVTGSSEKFEGIEGWAVFDDLQNNIFHGHFSGYFTLPKDGETYRIFWVDNGTTADPEKPGGSNFTDITTTNNPPSIPNITGPTSGIIGESYSYEFVSTDLEIDDLFYYIDWGDGTYEDWFGPNPSGSAVTKSHSWSEGGTYTIKAKARDTHGAESDWGPLTVQIGSEPKLKIKVKVFSIGKVCVTIQNKGTGTLSDIKWNVTVKGGIFRLFKRIHASANGTIETLAEGEKQVVCTPDKSIVFRFGIAKVTTTVSIGDKTYTRNQFVLVTGRLVFARLILLRA